MGFDIKGFLAEKFVPNTEPVAVPDLKIWFGDGDPAWVVRSMTGEELGRVNEAAQKNRDIAAIIEKLVSKKTKEKADGVQALLTGPDVPEDVAKRIEMLVIASVDPVCDLDLSLRLCKYFPVEFFKLTNKILELTGKGHIPGGRKPSGSKTT